MSGKKKSRIKKQSTASSNSFRIPRTPELINYDLKNPIFSFEHLECSGNDKWDSFDKACKASIANTIVKLGKLQWKQIACNPRESLGFEKMPRSQFSSRIAKSVTPDIEKLDVFRFSGPGRIAGFRRNEVFHIVLIDPGHDSY